MVRTQDWYDPERMKRARRGVLVLLIIIGLTILFLNQDWILPGIKALIEQNSY